MSVKDDFPKLILIIALTLLVYYNSFDNAFVWDDIPFIVINDAIKHLNMKSLISFFTDYHTISAGETLSRDVYRPLVTTSFAIDYKLWGLNPRPYHIENAVLHAFNAALVYIMTTLILGNPTVSLMAALLFSLHPVQTEAVSWISGRGNVLFLSFYLLALIFHIRAKDKKGDKGYLGLPIMFFALGLLSKEMMITLPAILILYDFHFSSKRGPRYYFTRYFPYLMVTIVYLIARFSVVGKMAQMEKAWGAGLAENVFTIFKALAGYIRLLFLPLNLRADYIVEVSKSIREPYVLIAVAVLVSVLLIFIKFRRNVAVSFYLLFFFVTLIPVSNIVPVRTIMAERFLYLPTIAFATLLSLALARKNRIAKMVGFIAFSFIIILYGAGTVKRNLDWKDEITLYKRELELSPENARMHYNLGTAYCKKYIINAKSKDDTSRYFPIAEEEFKRALEANPKHLGSYVNLGNLYVTQGLYDKAVEIYKKGLSTKEFPPIYNNLGMACYNKGLYDEAIEYFKKSIIYSKEVPAYYYTNLANAYHKKGQHTKAQEARRRASEIMKLDY